MRYIATFLFILAGCMAMAQPSKWYKKARKAQLNIIAYDATGQMLRSTNGFYIDADGTALTDYASLRGATRAVAIDESGKEWPVIAIAGASSLYDVAKIRVATNKATPLKIASTNSAEGEQAYILPYVSSKASSPAIAKITKAETFNEIFQQYTLEAQTTERAVSCPVLNEAGEVIGLLQLAANGQADRCYAMSAAFAESLATTALSATMADYRDLLIKKALPADKDQASSFIYLCGTRDTAMYLAYADDFIAAFPREASGYTMKAEMLAARADYELADQTWEAGIKAKADEAELLYSRSRSTYAQAQTSRTLPAAWTLERAIADIDAAQAAAPSAIYTALKAHILYTQKQYAEACKLFVEVTQTKLRDASYFLYAAQCQQMLADTAAALAYQDSAVACFTKPYPVEASAALLMRAQTHLSLNNYRLAVADLTDYEHLRRNELNANFYYQREQAEMRCRMFQQALTDIEQAVRLEPREPLYLTELAALNTRFGQMDEAIDAARKAIALDDSFADAHRILGVCLREQGKTEEARKALQRAAELGDTIAAEMLK